MVELQEEEKEEDKCTVKGTQKSEVGDEEYSKFMDQILGIMKNLQRPLRSLAVLGTRLVLVRLVTVMTRVGSVVVVRRRTTRRRMVVRVMTTSVGSQAMRNQRWNTPRRRRLP